MRARSHVTRCLLNTEIDRFEKFCATPIEIFFHARALFAVAHNRKKGAAVSERRSLARRRDLRSCRSSAALPNDGNDGDNGDGVVKVRVIIARSVRVYYNILSSAAHRHQKIYA